MRRVVLGLAGLVSTLAAASAFALAPPPSDLHVPTQDDAIVEHLPTHVGDAAERRAAIEAERAQRAQLQQHPNELGLALKAANDALERGRLRGDPRELGVAQAALEPWWNLASPPPEVRLVRATTLQSQHFFHEALVELDAILAMPQGVSLPVRAQAELTRSGVQQVLGHFAEAEAGCRRLAGPDFAELGAGVRLNGEACLAELSSLQGHADTAAMTLARLAGAPDTGSALTTGGAAPGWLNLMRAELAQRRGDPAAGALFAAALKATDDVYTECAYADWLLDQHRPADVLALLKGHEAADPVLLRIALADKAVHGAKSPVTVDATTMLGQRYDAALLRGDKSHGREQSRYELDLRGDTRAALGFATSNWSVQHEPADEVVLAHAAHAAHRDAAAASLWQFLHDTGGRDVRLAAGGEPAAPYLPVAFSGAKTPTDALPARPLNQALMAIVAANKAALAASAAAPTDGDAHVAAPADAPVPSKNPPAIGTGSPANPSTAKPTTGSNS